MSQPTSTASGEAISYRYCQVKLSLFSLCLLNLTIGICGGLTWAFISMVAQLSGLFTPEKAHTIWLNFITYPILAIGVMLILTIAAYPIYRWICYNMRGQRFSGIFYRPHN